MIKVKVTLQPALKEQKGCKIYRYSFFNLRSLDGVGSYRHAPAALPPGKETRYPLFRRLGGHQGWSGRARKILPPTGIRSRTVQPVANLFNK